MATKNINQNVLLLTLFLIIHDLTETSARGPHHPRSKLAKLTSDKHFHHEKEHIQEDLKQWSDKKDIKEMTEEEKNFYYFKLHDLDNNNVLDGLEMLNAATHHGMNDVHKLEEGETQKLEHELNHIIAVIDDFIEYADLDDNGLLNYPEYIRAINATAADIAAQKQEQS